MDTPPDPYVMTDTNADIKRHIAPVIAMLKHDVAHPTQAVLDPVWALEQLQVVLDLVNAAPRRRVNIEETSSDELRQLIQENLQRRD